ncbi:MAG TPA: hypothetical protein VGM27_06070 [Acidobacteriaceae bacterium]
MRMSADGGVGTCWSGVERAATRVSTVPPFPDRNRRQPDGADQTALVGDRLVAAHPDLAANGAVEIVTIRTTGDPSRHPQQSVSGILYQNRPERAQSCRAIRRMRLINFPIEWHVR